MIVLSRIILLLITAATGSGVFPKLDLIVSAHSEQTAIMEMPPISELTGIAGEWIDKPMVARVYFGDPLRQCKGPPVTRSDWCVHDETGAIYVTGVSPPLNDKFGQSDWGKALTVHGRLQRTDTGILYIAAEQARVTGESRPTVPPRSDNPR